jgi:xylulokinase
MVNEAGALGAAIIAGAGCGLFPSIRAGAEQMVKPGQTFYPDPAMEARYDERFEKYRRLWPLMKDYLSSIRDKG